MEQWANYFIATAGGAAALTGLIFVAVSLNLQRILSIKHLSGRALGSLMLLINIVIISSLCLVPKQPLSYLGSEVLFFGLLIWIAIVSMDVNTYRRGEKMYRPYAIVNMVFTQLAVVPYLVGGICLLTCCGEMGLYWLIPGITFSFIKALLDSWVLLVEINR